MRKFDLSNKGRRVIHFQCSDRLRHRTTKITWDGNMEHGLQYGVLVVATKVQHPAGLCFWGTCIKIGVWKLVDADRGVCPQNGYQRGVIIMGVAAPYAFRTPSPPNCHAGQAGLTMETLGPNIHQENSRTRM